MKRTSWGKICILDTLSQGVRFYGKKTRTTVVRKEKIEIGKAGILMSCESRKSCCTGECAGHCQNNDAGVNEIGLNTIVEFEIHYSESKEEAYIFEALYTLTNIQRKELKLTGLEGSKYDNLDIMKLQIIGSLTQTDSSACELYKDVDVLYIRDDI